MNDLQAATAKRFAAAGDEERPGRRSVIPAPRREGMFPGWGVRF